MSSGDLTRTTAGSAAWNGAANVGVQVLSTVTQLALAALLGPTVFGTVAVMLAVLAVPRLLGDQGLSPAIVTGRVEGAGATAAADLLVIGWGLVFAIAVLASASPVAAFFANEQVTAVLWVACAIPVFDGLGIIAEATLRRAHRFDRIARIETLCQLGASLGAIALALAGAGVWALVVPRCAARAVRSVALRRSSGLRVRRPDWNALRGLRTERAHVLGAGLASTVYRYADDVIVGRFFGAAELGLYSLAYSTFGRCLSVVSHAAAAPLMASLGTLAGDAARLDKAVVRAARTLARLTFPLMLGGALVAPLLIDTLLDARWERAGLLLRILFVVGAIQSIGALTGPVWLAVGRHRLAFWWGVASSAVVTAAFLCGATVGGSIEWVALAFAITVYCVTAPAAFRVTQRVCGLPLQGLLPALGRVLVDTAIMALAVFAIAVATSGWHAALSLFAQIVGGALSYATVVRALRRDELNELLDLLPRNARLRALRAFALYEPTRAAQQAGD